LDRAVSRSLETPVGSGAGTLLLVALEGGVVLPVGGVVLFVTGAAKLQAINKATNTSNFAATLILNMQPPLAIMPQG
jgi:hypothetical protein